MFFENMIRIFSREVLGSRVEEKKDVLPVKSKFAEDIMALKSAYPGEKVIDISLQDILKLCPRNRQRVDAYKGLISELSEQEGIELRITSRKKNKKEA